MARRDRRAHRSRAVPLHLAALLEEPARRLDGFLPRRPARASGSAALDVQQQAGRCPPRTGTAAAGSSGSGRTASRCRGSSFLQRRRPAERRQSRRPSRSPRIPPGCRSTLDPTDDRRRLLRPGSRSPRCPGRQEGGKPLTFTYQWRLCDAAGEQPARPISGCDRRVVQAGRHRRLEPLAQGHRDPPPPPPEPPAATTASRPRPSLPPASPPSERARQTSKPPQILGSIEDGQILTASVGSWTVLARQVHVPLAPVQREQRRLVHRDSAHATSSRRMLTPDDIQARRSRSS